MRWLSALACITFLLGGCTVPTNLPSASSQTPESATEAATETIQVNTLPDFSPIGLAGGKLRVVGLGLEEAMLPILDELGHNGPVVAVSTGISTLEFGEHYVDFMRHNLQTIVTALQ